MKLKALTDWIHFFASEEKILHIGNWSVMLYAYADQKATLVFERYSHRQPTAANPVDITQYIFSGEGSSNKLLNNIHFLERYNYDIDVVIAELEGMKWEDVGDARAGKVEDGEFTIMTYRAEK